MVGPHLECDDAFFSVPYRDQDPGGAGDRPAGRFAFFLIQPRHLRADFRAEALDQLGRKPLPVTRRQRTVAAAFYLPLGEPAPMQVLSMGVASGKLIQQRLVHPIQGFGVCPLRDLGWVFVRHALYGWFLQPVEPVVGSRGVDFMLTRAVIFAPADGPNVVVAD